MERNLGINDRAILTEVALLEPVAIAFATEHPVELDQICRQIFRVGELVPGHLLQFRTAVPEEVTQVLIEVEPHFVRGDDGQADQSHLETAPETLFTEPKPLFPLFATRNVNGCQPDAVPRAGAVEVHIAFQQQPACR